MSKYTTVRIDNETMRKLEHIVEILQTNNIGKVSKALAIKHIVDCEFERMNGIKEKNQ
jgi:predicted transcriptional regulator